MGFGAWGLGLWIWGLGFGVWGLGFGVWGLGFGVVCVCVYGVGATLSCVILCEYLLTTVVMKHVVYDMTYDMISFSSYLAS